MEDNIMKELIIAIGIDDDALKYESPKMKELQIQLFKQGYRWFNEGDTIRDYVSNDNIIIISDVIYTMSDDNIKYLIKHGNVKVLRIRDIISYYRYFKINKLKSNINK